MAQGAVLLGGRQVAVQWQDLGAAALERGLGAADFRHAGEEGENVAGVLRQRGANGAGHGVRQFARHGDVAFGVLEGDREHPAEAFDNLGVHQPGETGAVGGGGHRQQPQFGPQLPAQIEAQRESQVRLERTFVDFIQDHRRDAIEAGIGLQAAHQQALGDDLDPRGG